MADLAQLLPALVERHGPLEGEPEPLHGGITNRNFRVRLGGEDLVLRLAGRDTALLGIDRESERRAGEAAAGLGIAPEVLEAGEGYLLTRFVEAAPLVPEQLRADPAPLAAALRAFHDCGLALQARFWVPDLLESYAAVVRSRGVIVPAELERAMALVRRIASVLPLHEPVPCHDDLLASNLLRPAGGAGEILIVDWEYAGMGHRLFDLGNLAVNNGFDDAAEEALLAAYFGEPVSPARRAALSLMRIMSDSREAAWGLVQSVISVLDFDFSAYARRHFARLQAASTDPRLEGWLSAAAA